MVPRDINIAFDMHGCPNRCRHCWLGSRPNGMLSEDDLRWAAQQFRNYVRRGDRQPYFKTLSVVSWVREPDYADDYKQLYELEVELSDVKTYRAEWELLSVWRLAREEGYARWARQIGVETCQISLFGMRATTDWFYRREGAFDDCIAATERLIEAGIKPRWQWFLTKKIIPELADLLGLADKLKLRERVASIGGSFQFFLHLPGPQGEGRKIEDQRPTLQDLVVVPNELIEVSKHYLGIEQLWLTESELTLQMLQEEPRFPCTYGPQRPFFFIVLSNWDVFTNQATLEPWWKLGNLKEDGLISILDSYRRHTSVGLQIIYGVPLSELARRYANPKSKLVYTSRADLAGLWVDSHCENVFAREKK